MTPYTSVVRGIPIEAYTEAIEDARVAAERDHGVVLRWIYDIPGESGLESADATLSYALDHRPEALVGFGLGGPEIGVPRSQFEPHFTAARAAGLHSVPHSGESTGPQSVWDALTLLGAERIGHGTSSVQDPAAARAPRRARHPPRGVPDEQHRDPGRRAARGAPDPGHARRRRRRDGQQRRPADVRHDPEPRVRDRGRRCSTSTRPASPTWPSPPSTRRSPRTTSGSRLRAEIRAYAGCRRH